MRTKCKQSELSARFQLSRPLSQGKGQHVQEQAQSDGVHLQEEIRELALQATCVRFLSSFGKLCESRRSAHCSEQADARRAKNKEMRKRREERLVVKRKELLRKISESEDTTKKDEKKDEKKKEKEDKK